MLWQRTCVNGYSASIDCIGTELKACDKLLNEEYQKAMKRAK